MSVSCTPTYFSSEQLKSLDLLNVPKHIAIIPDGNRRWARQNASKINDGHRQGGDIIIDTVRAAKDLGIKSITFYLFSTENWLREPQEVSGLMWLLEHFLCEQRQTMVDGGMHFETIGDISALPASALKAIEETKKATAECTGINFIAALNYGARDEIKRAIKKISDDVCLKKINVNDITESLISTYLDTAPWGDPDMIIRTSGESRLSNFLLWQLSYSEFYITDTLWPDFKPLHLLEAVLHYQRRDRRLGGG